MGLSYLTGSMGFLYLLIKSNPMDINEQMIVLPSDTSYSVSKVGGRDKWSTLMEYNKDSREKYTKKVIEEVQEGKSVEGCPVKSGLGRMKPYLDMRDHGP